MVIYEEEPNLLQNKIGNNKIFLYINYKYNICIEEVMAVKLGT